MGNPEVGNLEGNHQNYLKQTTNTNQTPAAHKTETPSGESQLALFSVRLISAGAEEM